MTEKRVRGGHERQREGEREREREGGERERDGEGETGSYVTPISGGEVEPERRRRASVVSALDVLSPCLRTFD